MSRQAKPGSKPYRAQLRDRLTALGFSEEEIPAQVAKNLIVECGIPPRTAWRLASELSLDVAAHQYNAVTGDPRAGMRGTRIWEYEQWPERGDAGPDAAFGPASPPCGCWPRSTAQAGSACWG